ncbi:hypothetical protein EDB19DRAFT_796014 [Suillus lakei]|nr:hypothetical protein EDB19DRAFT_796014 [Suillus lakei]
MMPRANERIFTARPPDEHFVPPAQDTAWRSLCSAVDLSAIFDAEQGQPHSQCMENTRVALRESLRQVLDRHDRTNVWLKGLAGVGKTTIAFTVAKEMKSTQRLAASFFFSRKNVQRATMFIPTIAYQLALAFPRIKADIVKAIEEDEMLLSSKKSRRDQAQELIIKPLYSLRFRQAMSYVIVIDALDECFSTKEAAKLVELLIEMLSGADLPNIHLLFTSRPETHIRAAMQAGVHEISLITGDEATLRDVRVFLRVSLDNIRTNRPDLFGQLPRAWPSEDDFEALASRADGLFVYAALVIKFLSATGHQPQRRLSRLLRDSSAVNADLDQLYRQILTTSKNSIVHCRMLTCIIHLYQPLSLAKLQELFHEDEEGLAVMLEAFSPVILNPPLGNVEIYHSSLFDFMGDRRRSKQYYLDRARAHEYLACCCLKLLMQKGPMAFSNDYAFVRWDYHLSKAYPSSKLRNLLALFTKTELQRLVADALAADPLLEDGAFIHLMSPLHTASRTCLSFVSVLVMLDKWCVLTKCRLEMDQEPFGRCGCMAYCPSLEKG